MTTSAARELVASAFTVWSAEAARLLFEADVQRR